MPEHIKKKLQEEISALEHELSHELPKELKKAVRYLKLKMHHATESR